jgi:ferritin
MNTNRLSEPMAAALNAQLTKEANAAQIYLAYGAWAGSQGFGGVAKFLFRHAEEERSHMMKVLEYIMQRGAEVKVSAIAAPPANPTSISSCFEAIYAHEIYNTKAIYTLVKLSMEEEDWATWNFMQWFVKEQTEEETFAMTLLDKIKIAGNEKGTELYSFDRDLANSDGEERLAQDVTAANP